MGVDVDVKKIFFPPEVSRDVFFFFKASITKKVDIFR